MEDSKTMATPMSTTTTLDADEESEHVDQKEYRSMIGSLLYLMVTRPDIQFSICLCTHFQASPRTSHRQAVKRILGICITLLTLAFGTPRLLLWLFMVFQMRILPVVSWIGSPLLGLAISWDLLRYLCLPANSRVLLNPQPRQSILLQPIFALRSFGSHTPRVTLVRSIPMFHFNVTAPVP
jgi:hypothetical protein